MERGNLGVDANGEVTSGWNHEDESTDATPRGELPRSSDEAEQRPWSEGGRPSRRDHRANWKREELAGGGGGRQLSSGWHEPCDGRLSCTDL